MDGITLPPDLDQFAADEVAAGRFRDKAEVVAAGVDLLRRREAARAEFRDSVLAARQEADREGCITGDELLARLARKASSPA